MKYRTILAQILLLIVLFSPYTWNLQAWKYSSNRAAALQTQYSLNPTLTIEWLTDSDPHQTIIGYKIWKKSESIEPLITAEFTSAGEYLREYLIEETYIISQLTLADVSQKSLEQSVHYIGPLMLFIENADNKTFYDLSAKETLPAFLFEEIHAQKRDPMSLVSGQHGTSHKSLHSFIDSNYIYQTANYYAEFAVIPNLNSHAKSSSDSYEYIVIDPIDPQQYSLVFVP